MTVEDIRNALANKVVGIAGCGGLGSNCAVSLARSGIGKLVLVDFDTVDRSNLNRQYFFSEQIGEYKATALKVNINRIDKEVVVEHHILELDPSTVTKLFNNCDLIIEAFDVDVEKQMIIETVLSEMPDKYIISGQGLAGYGNNDTIRTQSIGNLFIIGDAEREVTNDQPPLGPRVGVVANMQANLALELLLKTD